MVPKEMTRRVLRELAAERASHGHGEATRLDRRMNKARGYLGRIIRGDLGLHVETLFEALEVLDVDPADFFGRVTGVRASPERLLRRLERHAPGDGPSVLDRFDLAVVDERIDVTIRFDDPPLFGDLPGRLERLDTELFCFPDRALRSAEEAVLAAVYRLDQDACSDNVELVCRALGAVASAYRVHLRFGIAARGLGMGFRLCEARGLVSARAELLLRTCYLIGDQGEYDLAVELARQASDACLLLRDKERLGIALIARAVMQDRLGHHTAAIEAYRLSLDHLVEGDWISKYSCLHGLGSLYAQLGDVDQARRYAADAAEAHEIQDGPNWWRLVWLQGDIAVMEEDFESAERFLRAAREGFIRLGNPIDIAIVSLRLARVLFMAGRVVEMREVASDMMRLLKPLEKHKIAGGAVYEFSCAALAGRVTLDLLDRIYRQVQKGAPKIGAP